MGTLSQNVRYALRWLVSAVASWIPALRATRVDPTPAPRHG